MENFTFKLEGPIFQEGVPIHIAIKAWDNFQSIIDRTHLGGCPRTQNILGQPPSCHRISKNWKQRT